MRRPDDQEAFIRELRDANERLLIASIRERELSEEREWLLRQAEEANRAKTDFLAVMSHELRTPLTAIMGYADLLRAGLSGPLTPSQEQQLGRITANARQLLQLIDEILSFSRIDAGGEGVQIERIELGELVREMARQADPLFAMKGLTLRVEAPEAPVALEADARKVGQILLRLLSNAAKFTERGGAVLAGRAEDGGVILEVRDTGIGIAPERLGRIFDVFWQAEQGRTRRAGGTGLGLAMAQQLARGLGGDITVRSRPGEGSTFTVWLPQEQGRRSGA